MDKNIEFETDQYNPQHASIPQTGMLYFLLKHKIVKNAAQANILLLAIAILFLFVSVLIFTSQPSQPDPSLEPDPDTLLQSGQ